MKENVLGREKGSTKAPGGSMPSRKAGVDEGREEQQMGAGRKVPELLQGLWCLFWERSGEI